jgi:putative ABC transport system substrate-binding protein
MMKRREFITLVGGAAAWSVAADAQAMPVIGYLSSRTSESDMSMLAMFIEGLGAAGYVENKNVAIEYRFAEGQYDQMPELAADLVRRRVAAIAVVGPVPALALKAATSTIPIVFVTSSDPAAAGLVASLSRPGGNVTGVTTLNVDVGSKRLELMHELVPAMSSVGLLVNPSNPNSEAYTRDMQVAARTLGLELHVLTASSEDEFERVFDTLDTLRPGGLVIAVDTLLISRSADLAALAIRHRVPAAYLYREFAAAGGLMSYGGSATEGYRQAGVYIGRILKGEKPADLPVWQATKVELIINLRTAKAIGLTIPESFLLRADEVIE